MNFDMNFEEAYQKTLDKWQRIAGGEDIDPASDCGLCEWARKRRKLGVAICSTCPAHYHYGHPSCAHLACMASADTAFLARDEPGLRHFAQQVVEELLSIKTSLFMEAEWIVSRKEE